MVAASAITVKEMIENNAIKGQASRRLTIFTPPGVFMPIFIVACFLYSTQTIIAVNEFQGGIEIYYIRKECVI